MNNPTVFAIGRDDVNDIMWLVDNQEPVELMVPGGVQLFRGSPQGTLDLIKQTIEKHGEIFASFYRPGAFWEEEVFVCPRCRHASQIEFAESIFPDTETASIADWYCKYCYTSWSCSSERGVFQV